MANRGECAVRIVRACHDLGIEAVAVYSTADRDGLWVELADRAVCIGPHQPAESYLNVQNLIGAAETTGCDALHPGWGFLAENAAFVGVCAENDLVFVGPPAGAMEVMGDKSRAREAMRSAGVPLVPGLARPPGRSRTTPGRWRPRSAIRCCSRPRPEAAGGACGS